MCKVDTKSFRIKFSILNIKKLFLEESQRFSEILYTEKAGKLYLKIIRLQLEKSKNRWFFQLTLKWCLKK